MTDYWGFETATGPSASVSSTTSFIFGIAFEVTASGYEFTGWHWWVAGDSLQNTGTQNCALWIETASGAGSYVSGTQTATGTLSPGWNFIPIATPVALSTGVVYRAVISATPGPNNHPFSDTAGAFTNGQVYGDGVVDGPLTIYSSGTTATVNPCPGSAGQMINFSGHTDVTAAYPAAPATSSSFYWLAPQVSTATTAISSSDTGSGSDSVTAIGVIGSDSATGAEGIPAISASLPGSDTASGTEAGQLRLASAETGSGTEGSPAITASLSGSDTAAGTEAASIGVSGPDSFAAAEASALSASVPGSDTGSATDGGSSLALSGPDSCAAAEAGEVALAAAETGSGLDSAIVTVPASDASASAAETSSLTATVADTDFGRGTDGQLPPGEHLTDAETGTASDTASIALADADSSAPGLDSSAISATLTSADVSAPAAETGSVPGIPVPISDTDSAQPAAEAAAVTVPSGGAVALVTAEVLDGAYISAILTDGAYLSVTAIS